MCRIMKEMFAVYSHDANKDSGNCYCNHKEAGIP